MIISEFIARLETHINECLLFHAVLSSPVSKEMPLKKITLRQLKNSSGVIYQMTLHEAARVTHANYPPEKTLEALLGFLESHFKQAVFFTSESDYHVLISKQKKWTILKKKPTKKPQELLHNRSKCHILKEGAFVPFLFELGVMRADGSILPKMAHKFRQINRFVEIIADAIDHIKLERSLNIVDFGCGKAYLTFALYHYLSVIQGRDVKILGLDLKKDVVENCEILARSLQFDGLAFKVGDINNHVPEAEIDMVVSLHACDTATDAALEKAIRWNAEVILCVPCCQHELFGQVKNQALIPILKHGILKERFAALATDAARAQILEICGYKTSVMEFIDLEHTPKNLLIRAIRGHQVLDNSKAVDAYRIFSKELNILPSLQRRVLREI